MESQQSEKKGRLKIYLGYAVGVGKTYAMLTEAHSLKQAGTDIVVGHVEPHGRRETEEKLEGLESIPQKFLSYRDVMLHEPDVAAIMERRPSIVLIDEIAHTNAPGSERPKRHEDVALLLAAGIDVITTLNIQHLESLAPLVERQTGIRISERVADGVAAAADCLINIDLPVRKLLQRIKEGKIYTPEMIETALSNFFAKPNLKFLRKLTLEWLQGLKKTAG